MNAPAAEAVLAWAQTNHASPANPHLPRDAASIEAQ